MIAVVVILLALVVLVSIDSVTDEPDDRRIPIRVSAHSPLRDTYAAPRPRV